MQPITGDLSLLLPSEWRELEAMCDQLFASELIQKFYSFTPLIRHRIVVEAGRLIFLFTGYCVRTGYASFLVDLLHDSDPEFRHAGVKILDECVYYDCRDDSLLPQLRSFTEICKNRLFSAINDTDQTIGVAVINLLTKIDSLIPGFFPAQDLHQVFLLTLNNDVDERSKAAAKCMHNHFLQVSPDPKPAEKPAFADLSNPSAFKIVEEDGTERCDKNSNLGYLVQLWDFVANFGSISNVPALVKNLAPICPSLRDWNGFVSLLLMSRDGFYEGVPTTGFIVLLRSAVCYVFDKAREQASLSKKSSASTPDEFAPPQFLWFDEWRRMSELLLANLPRLIRHFLTIEPTQQQTAVQQSISSHNIFLLIQLLPTLDIKILEPKNPHFSDLLKCLREVFDQTGNHPLLDTIAKTFKMFEDSTLPGSARFAEFFKALSESYRCEIIDSIAGLRRRLVRATTALNSRGNLPQRHSYEMTMLCFTISSHLNKLANLAQHFNLTSLQLEQQCLAVLQMASEKKIPYGQLIEVSTRYVVTSLSWLASQNSKETSPDSRLGPLVSALLRYLFDILRQAEFSYLSGLILNFLRFLRAHYPSQFAAFEKDSLLKASGNCFQENGVEEDTLKARRSC